MLGIAVLVFALFALRHPQGHGVKAGSATGTPTTHATTSTAVKTTPPASTSHPATKSTSATGKLPLVVLNNTTIQGLAKQAAQTFEAGGWTVTKYDNYTNDIISTCAYYDPAYPGAQAAATALQAQFPAIKRVQPKFTGLTAGPIVVVLTPDYASG
jgi:hypothetical protein